MFPEAKVTGFDFVEQAIEAANNYWGRDLSFSTNDITQENGVIYDIVSMFEVLEHIEDWRKTLDQIMNIADKYIILSFPTGKMRPYEKHIGRYRNFIMRYLSFKKIGDSCILLRKNH